MQCGETSGSVVDVKEGKEGRERKAEGGWSLAYLYCDSHGHGGVRGRALRPEWIPRWFSWVRTEDTD
jgi:hypothetical protein